LVFLVGVFVGICKRRRKREVAPRVARTAHEGIIQEKRERLYVIAGYID